MNFWQMMNTGLLMNLGVGSEGGYTLVILTAAAYIVTAIAAYLLGSINTALIVSKGVYKKDIREYGSNNAGMTNMFRVFGKKAGILTLLGDVLKAFAAVLIGSILVGKLWGGAHIAGFFCVTGHVFPVFYRFKGGKGVLVAAVAILWIEPVVFLFVMGVWLLMFVFTKMVSLSSITAAAMYPLLSASFSQGTGEVFIVRLVFSLGLALFVIAMHKDNIRRMLDGNEKRVDFKKLKDKKSRKNADDTEELK